MDQRGTRRAAAEGDGAMARATFPFRQADSVRAIKAAARLADAMRLANARNAPPFQNS
ncbi:MAG: hypothetical protein ACRECP_07110 [Methylocella sp.]